MNPRRPTITHVPSCPRFPPDPYSLPACLTAVPRHRLGSLLCEAVANPSAPGPCWNTPFQKAFPKNQTAHPLGYPSKQAASSRQP